METYVVVPTHNRNELVLELVQSLELPAERVLIIDNASNPPVPPAPSIDEFNPPPPVATLLLDFEQPPNLSRLWNLGIDWAEKQAGGREHAVAVLNDDVVLPPLFLDYMVSALRQTGADIAFPDQHGRVGLLHRTIPGPVPLRERMTGYAFVLRGGVGLRADERFRWWCGDDDLEWQALERGGTVCVGGIGVQHLYPDRSTRSRPELEAQTHRDRTAFVQKWGRAPW
ncbi:glycosyltransferase family 2 protein [Saccharothrix xinjiangensis]|uniref:Glycosyltransferase family 2 protein n=1 Tax=Saccharothrix xinjiangensis TaxID=204798 RepID=A0ABV9XVW7_9PSEU